MNRAEQILCQKYECELDELQLNITLNPDAYIIQQAMKQIAWEAWKEKSCYESGDIKGDFEKWYNKQIEP